VILGADLPGSSSGASKPKSSGASSVQRRTLVATDTQSGTLGFAHPRTVFGRLSGTITWLPAVGALIKPGQAVYKVDGAPVTLMDGTVPAYRDLSQGVSDGPDIQQLKTNLVALGFDPSHQITINQTYDSATASAVDNWQSSLGETQTGSVTLGHVVFLPGPQRITSVTAALGGTGGSGSGSSGSGSSGSSGSSGTGASTPVVSRPQYVSLTTPICPTGTQPVPGPTPGSTPCSQRTVSDTPAPTKKKPTGSGGKQPTTEAALLALLKAETLELQKALSGGGSSSSGGRSGGSGGTSGGGSSGASGASARGGGGGGSSSGGSSSGGGGSSGGGSGGSSSGSGASSSGAGSAQAILQTTSTQQIVTVNLDATKQSEATVNEPVNVQLPDGSTVSGHITQVSPVAQSSSSSGSSGSSGSGGSGNGGSGGSSGTPTATVPITISLTGRHQPGLDQAAVSVNFQQQKASDVLSVPVTALLAQAGGGYAVQTAAAPHHLIPVTPGLFAAGFVQISGENIYPGLQVTDSQG
jgi:hypothetical protein